MMKVSKINQQKIIKAQLLIQNNLDADLRLDSIAKNVGVSSGYLHRLFKANIGETIKQYVDRLRVKNQFTTFKYLNFLYCQLRLNMALTAQKLTHVHLRE